MPPREVAAQILDAPRPRRRSAEPVEISGPGFINLTLTDDWLAAAVAEMAADPRLGVPRQPTAEHPDRLLGAQRRQGDARRAPAHHGRRRRPGPHAGAPRPPRDPAEPHRRLGHAVRHAHRAPARRRGGLARGRACSSPTRTPSTRRPARDFDGDRGVRRPGPGPGGLAPGRRPRDACASGASSSTCRSTTSTGSTTGSASR